MARAMLPYIQSSKGETKDLYLAYECCQCSSRYILLTICQQALTHQLKISQEALWLAIRSAIITCGQRRSNTVPHKGELTTIWFLGTLQTEFPIILGHTTGIIGYRLLQRPSNRTVLEGLRIFLRQCLDG